MEETNKVVDQLVDVVKVISGFPECRSASKKLYSNLVRSVNLLIPLFEELKDSEESIGDEEIRALVSLRVALFSAKGLLQSVNNGSKLYQALKRDQIADKFHDVRDQIEKALSEISYDKLNISEEVREQIELIHSQFRRAKGRMGSPDVQLYMDLNIAQKEKDPDLAILRRLSEQLQLKTINDLKKESLALHEMVISCGGDQGECLKEMSALLKKLKDYVLIGNPDMDTTDNEKKLVKHSSPIIPDDFQCPISLELMKDPVIISTGQTYERSYIQKWLDAGHKTCPKSQQTLLHTALTPNYVLRSLIAQWCESNGVELPKKQGSCRKRKLHSCFSDCDRAAIDALLNKLSNGNTEEQMAAAGELQLLANRNSDYRICIAEAGAIPLLVELLSYSTTHAGLLQGQQQNQNHVNEQLFEELKLIRLEIDELKGKWKKFETFMLTFQDQSSSAPPPPCSAPPSL